jgi:hypothetical protein
MSKILPLMGSPDWANAIFSTPPVRTLKGHSKRTQLHRHYSFRLNQFIEVQGRNEACTVLAIEYLICLGLLKRVKPQPFITDAKIFGNEICPDFLVEAMFQENLLFVIETKSARFLTRIKNLELDSYRERFAGFNIKYLVWTDCRPLSHSVRHHLLNMRASAQRNVTEAEIQSLVSWIKMNLNSLMEDFYSAGFDLDCLYAAAWEGHVFFPLTKPFTAKTPLACSPLEDYKAIFLDCENKVDDWWKALPNC